MKAFSKIAALTTAGLLACTAAFADVTKAVSDKAFDILEETDKTLAYHGDYSATVSLVVEKPGKPKESMQYKIFQRTDDDLMTMVQLFPEADKGTGYLMNGDNIWVYDPIGRKFTHTSLKESLGDSDVDLNDLDRSDNDWKKHYEVDAYSEGTLGKYEVHIITLHAITIEPSYAYTTYYIRKDVPLMLKQENFSNSRRLMRTVLLPKYTKVPAGYVPTQVINKDEINKGENTQTIISDLSFDKLPDSIFTKAYLEGLN